MSDGGWLNAPAGLLRQDHSPKPAYEELLKLIKGEWWLQPTKMTTDTNGQLSFTGFLGQYEVTLDKQRVAFEVKHKGEARITLEV